MNKIFNSIIVFLVNVLLTQSVQAAGAVINSDNLLDNILRRFSNTASGWGTHLLTYATWLFWVLALISMVWTYSFMALKKADLQEFFAETIRFFVTTGFFFWLLQHGPAIAIAIMDSCRQMAAKASGLNKSISPSGIVDIGFDIASKVADQSSVWSPATSIVGLIIAAVILIILALVSINLLLILITGWLIAYGGVFLLGFGGGRWTQDIAITYYKEVLGIGMQMFAMVLLVGIGRSFIDQYYAAMGNDMAFKELLVMLVVAIVLLTLVDKIPPLFARMVGGSGGGGGGGIGSFGLGAAVGAAGMAGAMASGAAAGALGAATSMAGGGSALKAAFAAAQNSMSQSSPGQGATNRTAGSLTSAMGMASQMGSYLAKGASQTFNDKLGSIKEAAQERISGTVGGKIAEAIHQMNPEHTNDLNLNDSPDDASNEGAANYSFSGDTLSGAGGTNTDNQYREIEEFVNKSSSMSAGEE